MVFLLLSILSSASIYIIFKLIDHFKVHTFSAIVINYFAACLAGFFLSNSNPFTLSVFNEKWFLIASIIGVMFIVMFYVIGKSTQKAGVAVTTVAVKMSVIFPIAFSIWYDASDVLTLLKSTGITLAIFSVFLTVYQGNMRKMDWRAIFLPSFIFLGMGVVDSFVKYAQSEFITTELTPVFSTIVFTVALFSGVFVLPFNPKAVKSITSPKAIILGLILGLVNFGSMYFLILALNHIDIDTGKQAMGSVIFGINNIGIVALSVITGFLFFKERPSKVNWLGIAISIIAIIILSFS